MRPTTLSTCLFGGALFAAGLHTAPALAAPMLTFGAGYSSGTIEATGSGGYLLVYGTNGPSPFADGAYTGGGLDATFDASRMEVSFTHDRTTSDTWDTSRVAVVAYFTVNEGSIGRVTWDFGSWEGSNQAQLINLDSLSILIDDAGTGVGNRTAVLTPGVQYGVFLVTQGALPGGPSFGKFSIEPLDGCNDADIDKNGVLNLDDINAFVEAFVFGCP